MELEILEAHPPAGAAPGAPPFLFVHGAWHAAWCWERVLPLVASRGHDAYAVSLRGHGRSARPRRFRLTTLGDYVEDVASAVARIGPAPVLVGHSMGGLMVQRFVAAGGRAAALVLLAPVPRGGALGATLRVARRHPLPFLEGNVTWRLWPVMRSPRRAREMLLRPSAGDDEVRAVHGRLQDEAYLAYLGMLAPGVDPAAIRVPVRVIGGGEDALFTERELRATARAHGVELVLVPGAAHDLMLDPAWEAVTAGIVDWARGAVAAGGRAPVA